RTGHLHAIDVAHAHAREAADGLRNLLGRDVLTLPPEGVADPVDEVEVALLVDLQQVAGPEERVALLEAVAQDLALGRLGRGVALEAPSRFPRLARKRSDHLADLAGLALDQVPALVAHVRVALDVVSDQPSVHQQLRRDATHRAGL